jgi:hypothetical protein
MIASELFRLKAEATQRFHPRNRFIVFMKTMSFIVAREERSLPTCGSAISGSPFAACGDSPSLR